jgi:hypothetical protein
VSLGVLAAGLVSACRSGGLPRLRRPIATGELGNILSVMVLQDGKTLARVELLGRGRDPRRSGRDPRRGMRDGHCWWLGQGRQTTPAIPWFAASSSRVRPPKW